MFNGAFNVAHLITPTALMIKIIQLQVRQAGYSACVVYASRICGHSSISTSSVGFSSFVSWFFLSIGGVCVLKFCNDSTASVVSSQGEEGVEGEFVNLLFHTSIKQFTDTSKHT